MRIRKGSFHHRLSITPPPPPDLVSSTATGHPPRSPSFGSPSTGKLCELTSSSSNADVSLDPTEAIMTSIINASACSNQLHNPRIFVGEKEGAISPKNSTASNTSVDSGCNSGTASADASDATSASLALARWWCEEEKMFPVKKRRLSLERFLNRGCGRSEEEEQIKKNTWAGEGNKSCYIICQEKECEKGVATDRCSRSNGVGWRCCRRRLEGFAWCRHHVKCEREKYRKHKKMSASNDGGGGGKALRMRKRRKRVMMMSNILDRTEPMLANTAALGF